MLVKNKTKRIEFGEQDEGFIKKLAEDIGCHYCKANERTYNLNKYDSDIDREKGVFAWVHKERNNCFWIATRKIWVEEAKTKVFADGMASGINCFPRDNQPTEDSVYFDTKDGYKRTVCALRLMNKADNHG